MDNFFNLFKNDVSQQDIVSGGASVVKNEIKFFKKKYDKYPQHNKDNYDEQKFSNVVDSLQYDAGRSLLAKNMFCYKP